MSPEYAYTQLFNAPSALQHSWSLSIEAQYYLAFPLVVALCLARGGRLLRLGGALLALCALSIITGIADSTDPDAINRAYYDTLSRAAEPLIGALLALVLNSSRVTAALAGGAEDSSVWRRGISLAGLLAGLAMAMLWNQVEVATAWLYRGGFAFHALLSALLLVAALDPGSVVQRVLALPPLPWLGRLSYGAYVYHWPIFLVLSPDRTGLAAVPLLAVRVTATFAIAWASYRFVELPIRHRKMLASWRAIASASLIAPACVAIAVVWSEPTRFTSPIEPADQIAGFERPPRIAMFGDSTALTLAKSLMPWLGRHGMDVQTGGSELGCSLLNRGESFFQGSWKPVKPRCVESLSRWRRRGRRISSWRSCSWAPGTC
jgi:peptidoglycan/LPS O-acetylase OafA/YrhL